MPEVLSGQVADFTFRIGEATTEELQVTGFTGTEGISTLFQFRVDLISDNAEVDLAAMVGQGALLEIRGSSGHRYVNGIVRRFERSGEGVHKTHYVAEIVPIHWLLTRRHRSRIFQEHNCPDMTVPGIIRKVLQDAGVPEDNFRFALEADYPAREYVVQYRESEMDFISRLAEEEGIFYFFEHTASGHKMVFGDSGVANVATPNEAEFPFRDVRGLVPEKEFFFSVRDSQSIQIGAVSLDDFNFEQPATALISTITAGQFSALDFVDYPGDYVDKSIGDRLAQVRLEEHQCARRVLHMASTARGLIPGYKFTLIEHPIESVNREYLVTHITHRAAQAQAGQEEVEASQLGTRHEVDIRCIPSDVPFRPPRVTPRPTILGSQTAIVVGPQGEEIYTDKYGRVKVQFHWDREGQYNENSSCWIRVNQGLAGGQYGMMFLPRIGQEVVVDFLEGNPDRPLITGRVFNGDLMPPYTLPDEKTKSTIKTHSSKGGGGCNEIRFEDLKDNEQLLIQAQRQMDTRVKASHFHTVGGSYDLTVGGEDGGGLYGEYHQLVYKAKHTHVKGEVRTLTEQDESHVVQGKVSNQITGTHSTTIDGDVVEDYKSNQKTTVASTLAIKAASIKLQADSCIEITCGGSSIHVTPSAVFIKGGPTVNINTGSGPAVGPVSAGATSPQTADDPGAADVSQPGRDVLPSGATTPVEPIEPITPPGPQQPVEPPPGQEKVWVAISLVDETGQPVPGEPCELTLPNGRVIRGTLDANGRWRVNNVDPGTCRVRFPRLDESAWDRVENHPPTVPPPAPPETEAELPPEADEGIGQPGDPADPERMPDPIQMEQQEIANNEQQLAEGEEEAAPDEELNA